ncbi:MAG: hypothetical protein C0485_03580 [Pirellula sp.]|nr:hypothetical protein [Pirellula sp.]
MHNPGEFTLAGYGGEFPGGRMYITAVWGSLSDDSASLVAELEQDALLPYLERIEILDGGAMTDAGLTSIGTIRNLRRLRIEDAPQVTDDGVQELLNSLSHLESLELTLEQCTDAAVDVNRGFPKMTHIDVSFTHLTDSGLLTLIAKAPRLESLDVTGTLVTALGASRARQPNLVIIM